MRAISDKPFQPASEAGQPVQRVSFDALHSKQGNQSHERADLERDVSAVRTVNRVVEETVLGVPKAYAVATQVVDGVRNVNEVLKEFRGDVLVGWLGAGQFQSHGQHVQAVHTHPSRAVRLFQVAAGGQRRAAVKDADVVQPQEAAFENVVAVQILAVHPPGEVQHEFVEGICQEIDVALTAHFLLDVVDVGHGPGVDRGIDVAEVPLVGRNLAIGMQVILVQHQFELFLGKVNIHHGQGNGVESQVPGRVPGIFPLVRHGDDVFVDHVIPTLVAHRRTSQAGEVPYAVPIEPLGDVIIVKLLGPQHAGQCLAHHAGRVREQILRRDAGVEGVCLPLAGLEYFVEVCAERVATGVGLRQRFRGHVAEP